MKKKLRSKSMPFLTPDGDCIDEASFPWGQALTRNESFHEMLEDIYT